MWAASRPQLSFIQLIISIGLCFALNLAATHLTNPENGVPKTHFKPPLLSTNNNSALTDDALKSHDEPTHYSDDNSDEEARGIEDLLNAFGPIINKFQGEGTSSLTEPLLQIDAKTANGDKKLVIHLQKIAERTEAQDSQLVATIERIRASEHLSDQTISDVEYTHLLTNPKSAKVLFDIWSHDQVTPLSAIKRLDRSFTYSSLNVGSLRNFFDHRLALPWLSYVGYCWKFEKGEFTEEKLFQFLQEASLEVGEMATLLHDARQFPFGPLVFDRMQRYSVISPSTRTLAFYLEIGVSEIKEISKFWDMLLSLKLTESPLNVWLEYVAFRYPHVMEPDDVYYLDVAIAVFLDSKHMSLENRTKMFEQISNDMGNKKVVPTLYAPNLLLEPFAKPTNPHEFLQRDKNLKALAEVMSRLYSSY